MPDFRNMALVKGFVFALGFTFTTACLGPYVNCDCGLDYNLTIRIRDGGDSSCVQGAKIGMDNGIHPSAYVYDSLSCAYRVPTGTGTVKTSISKTGYDSIPLEPMKFRYHDDGCCGNHDRKTVEIYWYKSDLDRAPGISVL